MAWLRKTRNGMGAQEETVTQAASATSVYSSVIDFLKPKGDGKARYVSFWASAPTLSTGNVDFALYGSLTSAGTKFLLLDAPIADISTTETRVGTINIELYPAPYYWIGMLAAGNESANSITLRITPEVL